MKINGIEVSRPNRVTLVLPREDGEDIVIIAQAVTDLDRLEELCPAPQPPVSIGKGGEKVQNFADSGYKAQLFQNNLRRLAYLVLKSLEPSDIEWETVDMDDPGTWVGYVEELKAAGFSQVEINLIGKAAMQANALDEDKLEAARQVFLRGRAAAEKSSGPHTQQ